MNVFFRAFFKISQFIIFLTLFVFFLLKKKKKFVIQELKSRDRGEKEKVTNAFKSCMHAQNSS